MLEGSRDRRRSAEETGLVSFDGLEISSEYRLVEYMAPGGYVLPKGQWILTYDKDKKAFGISGSVKAAVTPAFEYVKEGIPIEGTEKVFYRVRNYDPANCRFPETSAPDCSWSWGESSWQLGSARCMVVCEPEKKSRRQSVKYAGDQWVEYWAPKPLRYYISIFKNHL